MQTRKRLVPVARAKTVGLWALGSLSAAGAWDPHLPAEVKVGGWGPSWDVLEDLLWTDPASRIPAPPCLLPCLPPRGPDPSRETKMDPEGCPVSAQSPLSAQPKQGLKEKSSSETARGSGNANGTERKCAPGFLSPSAYTKGDAPENSTQQRLLLIINARGKQGQNSKGLLWGMSTGVLVTWALSLGFQGPCHPLSIFGLGAEGEMHVGVSWDPAS